MFRLSVRILPALLLVAAAVRLAQGAEREAPPIRLLVPAYFYPAGDGLAAWRRMIESAEKTPIVAIVNPDSGPGKRADENYRAIFKLAQKSKITLIGYVTFSYAQRPLSAVKADIDSWLHFYPEVQGILFDEQPSQAEQAEFANECFAYARQRIKNAVVVSNPGVVCAQEYLSGRDAPAACLFEHEAGFDNYRLPDWAAEMSRDKFAVLLYGTKSTDQMRASFARAIAKHSGFIYITDGPAPMPWGGLPSYWDEEVAAAADANKKGKMEEGNAP